MSPNIFLEYEEIYLRPLEEDDISSIYLNGINDQAKDLFTDHALYPKNLNNLLDFAKAKWNSRDIWLGIFLKSTNEHIGNIEIFNIELVHRKAEYAIILWDKEGKGYAYKASYILLKHLFIKLNLNRVSLSLNEKNLSALKLYKRLGFQVEGTQREAFFQNDIAYDFLFMGLLKKDFINVIKLEEKEIE